MASILELDSIHGYGRRGAGCGGSTELDGGKRLRVVGAVEAAGLDETAPAREGERGLNWETRLRQLASPAAAERRSRKSSIPVSVLI